MPTLQVVRAADPPLVPLSSHALPHGTMAWLSWLFERPTLVAGTYDATIDCLELASAQTGRSVDRRDGPWRFRFKVAEGGHA